MEETATTVINPVIAPVQNKPKPIVKILLTILIIFLIAAGIGTYLVFGSRIIVLPINPKEPQVKSFAPFYNFEVEAAEIKEEPRGWIIVPKNNNTNYPEFIVNNTVLIVFKAGPGDLPAKLESLQPNQRLIITSGYDIDKKTWKINKIAILSMNL